MSTHPKDTNKSDATREKELETQLKRALADYDNLKKRFDKEKGEVAKFSNELLLMNLISVVDGLSMTLEQLTSILMEAGFTEIKVQTGDAFNPQIMEATETDGKGDTVVRVYNSAYKLHEKLIRPARVKVGTV